MPETMHVNCVTTMLNADELILEFRRVELGHVEVDNRHGKADYTADDVRKSPVLARIAVTFSAAIVFANQLSELIPKTHEFRVRQSAPWLTQETLTSLLGKKVAEEKKAE